MTNIIALVFVAGILYFVIKFSIDYWFIIVPMTILVLSIFYFSSDKGEKKLKLWADKRLLRKTEKRENIIRKERNKIESQFNVDSIRSKIESTIGKIERLNNMKSISKAIEKSNNTELAEFENKYKLLIQYFEEYYQRYSCIYIKAILNVEIQKLKKIDYYESDYDFIEFKNIILNKLNSIKKEVYTNLNKYALKINGSIDNEILDATKKIDEIIIAYLNIETNKLIKETSPIMENEFMKKLLSIEKEITITKNEFNTLDSEFDRLCAEIEIAGVSD